MSSKAITTWAAILLVAWLVVTHPAASGHLVHNIGNFVTGAMDGLKNFASSLKST